MIAGHVIRGRNTPDAIQQQARSDVRFLIVRDISHQRDDIRLLQYYHVGQRLLILAVYVAVQIGDGYNSHGSAFG